MPDTIVIAGALAQKPRRGGHTWVFLQYLLGFQRLGWDVLFVDALPPDMCVDAAGAACSVDTSANLAYLRDVMARAGLARNWALLSGEATFGATRGAVERAVRGAAFVLNVNGFLREPALIGAAQRRVFLDIDPGVPQMWHALGLHNAFDNHDDFVTIGQRIGTPDCPIPACGLEWITTAPPVVLEHWPSCPSHTGSFTSVASWRGAFAPIDYDGRTYGQRVHEFRKFLSLPRRVDRSFELALDIHSADTRDIEALAAGGWTLTDPLGAAGDPWTYRAYVQRSAAELMVAKGLYVDTRCGWMSDRSVCYLASGKPVAAQDTGLRDLYGGNDGLVLFTNLEEAESAVNDIGGRYAHHAAAARALAERHFDSDVVLTTLLRKLGVPSPTR